MTNNSEKYKKLSHREHILQRPGMYIGSITNELKEFYIPVYEENFKNIKFIKKEINFNPGFIKIFDEILTNASDHYIRTEGEVKKIKIEIKKDYVCIENDGPSVSIENH